MGTATVSGTVSFHGKPVPSRPVNLSKDAQCAKQHPDGLRDNSLVLNSDNTIQEVFVWIEKGLEGWKFPVPKEPVILSQLGCMYSPHVLGVMAKQPIQIRNDDSAVHNVHCLAKRSSKFNISQQTGASDTKTFRRPEVMVNLICDIHPWMNAHIGVLSHPAFSVTNDKGAFRIPNLPPGKYTIAAWQDRYGIQKKEITIGDGESLTVDFTYPSAP